MNVIVVAAGAAVRLGKVCENLPKALLSFGGMTAFDRFMSKVKMADGDRLCVVVSNDYRGKLLKGYVQAKYASLSPVFAVQPEPIGTCDAVARAVDVLGENWTPALVAWSDIMPMNEIEFDHGASVVFTSSDFPCRYNFWNGELRRVEQGNVIGMYFVNSAPDGFIDRLRQSPRADFVEIMPLTNPVPVEIRCHDFGTPATYRQLKDRFDTSAYARVEKHGFFVTKKYGDLETELFKNEAQWYKHLPPSATRFVPPVESVGPECTIRMRYVYGLSPDFDSPDEMKDFLARVVYVLDEFFHSSKYPSTMDSLCKEYVEKPLSRSAFVREIVPGLSSDYVMINGKEYRDPSALLSSSQVTHRLVTILNPPTFGFLHGDPTLQNMIVSADGKITLLDPKGKFGSTAMYGDPGYDFAKLYYSFCGNYDGFNKGQYSFEGRYGDLGSVAFKYEIAKSKFACLGGWYLDYLHRHLGISPTAIKLLHALIWLRVSGYVLPQSIEQGTVAYLNGTVLLHEAMSEAGW